MLSLTIRNQVSEIRRMSLWLEEVFQRWDLPAELLFKFDLCANEAVTNIISYAFAENSLHEITLQLRVDAQAAILEIRDDGKPFNPLAAPEHVRPATLEDAEIGGLGIDLVRRFMDECSYTRDAGWNVLRLTTAVPRSGALPAG